jgi:prevent-host-death family protein
MEIIGAFDARTRLGELLERTEHGETFQITKHGRPVGKLVPPDAARDPHALAAAVARLKNVRSLFGKMSKSEILALRHEGHRF